MRVIEKEENLNLPTVQLLPEPDDLIEPSKFHHNPAKEGETPNGVPNVPPGTPAPPYVAPISVNRSMTREEIS